MNASTILTVADRYMQTLLEAAQNNAAAYDPNRKETTVTIIQSLKSSATGIYTFAHILICNCNEDEDKIMPLLNELEALYCDICKPAFDKLLQEVKAK